MNQSTAVLADLNAAWSAAASPWDPAALAKLYSEDALFYGGRVGHAVGHAAIEAYFASYDGIIVAARLDLVEQHLRQLAPDCWMAQGYGRFTFELSSGKITQSQLRTTWVVAEIDGAWRIRQHHFSPTPAAPPLGDA